MSVVQISHLIKYALAATVNVFVASNQSSDVSLLRSSAWLYITCTQISVLVGVSRFPDKKVQGMYCFCLWCP